MPARRLLPVLLATLLASCQPTNAGFARAADIERLDQGIGGPKAAARPGDILLENAHLRVVIPLCGRSPTCPTCV